MHRATLDDGSDNHDAGAAKDGPAAAEAVIDYRDQGERKNGAQRVGGGNDALERALGIVEV